MVLHRAVTSSGLFHLRRSPFVQCGQAESARKQWEHAADAEAAIAAGNDNDANDKETLGHDRNMYLLEHSSEPQKGLVYKMDSVNTAIYVVVAHAFR
jgi:hypothetical protein